ncbi:MAG: XrtA-associated tyrosine autokinase [Methylicorpusculum sp.]|uniref:XrtA-associated tyrosine autokinase n=2 Tax=Methylicorpusculum sp. TaxID=2713644 RepID=UPI0027173FE1|nr:XrtA-associated tyrosine autokinase [Methylicorpusculum sp.]MDO8846003.1 XrtA-associated tyrosine autokinase [Methylicorpusculum sp.]MDO8938508.1 XrtA-associated tyrosine autokinase [Methylicorpusculum sp.]MDP2177132.1 XrtA-associated tyrosine autokinase [Methylicorpusculum sp.]MDP2202058.1 XrtA-associated tyrosine autokinase [Methylicorpusculum sp.]MDP3531274.1 XrtA-associated tyrosine autokinase [Methylicorpusculum sp.]
MNLIEKALEKATAENDSNASNEEDTELDNPSIHDDASDETEIVFYESQTMAHKNDKSNSEIETFNWDYLRENGFIDPTVKYLQIAEEFRTIKRPLVINALSGMERGIERSNLILITSSVPGEGKSFTAINLAISIAAERDKQVLLIDADVAKPSISRVLGIKKGPGLIEYLEGKNTKLSDIILKTEIDGLRIVPAGKSHQFSTELLASNKMLSLAQELSERYADRIVIFDSPPLLAATQAEVLSSMVGQVVLVIEAEQTAQNIVMESVKKLEACDVVLALLNKTKRGLDMNYYGYGQY